MTMAYYSRQLGLDENYLCVYRSMRNLPKGTEARKLYESYKKELAYAQEVVNQLQDIYYELDDAGLFAKFARHCKHVGIYKHACTLHEVSKYWFLPVDNLKGKKYIEKMLMLIAEYEVFKNANRDN